MVYSLKKLNCLCLFVHLLSSTLYLACAPTKSVQKRTNTSSSDQNRKQVNNDAFEVDFSGLTEVKGSGSWTNRIWLNFEGATVTKAESFIVEKTGNAKVDIPRFESESLGVTDLSREQQVTEISDRVAKIFKEYEISFTTKKPDSGGFTAIHIGGKDFRKGVHALGVAPLDTDNFSGKDIGFNFPEELDSNRGQPNLDILANAIAHEVAHCLGASHINNDTALMNPTVDVENFNLEATAQILRKNIGLVAHRDTSVLPIIKKLTTTTQGSVKQLSVYNQTNIDANQQLNLGLYKYSWKIGGKTFEGTGIRIPNSETSSTLSLTVSSEESQANSKEFVFTIP